jgi:hypothetical protein
MPAAISSFTVLLGAVVLVPGITCFIYAACTCGRRWAARQTTIFIVLAAAVLTAIHLMRVVLPERWRDPVSFTIQIAVVIFFVGASAALCFNRRNAGAVVVKLSGGLSKRFAVLLAVALICATAYHIYDDLHALATDKMTGVSAAEVVVGGVTFLAIGIYVLLLASGTSAVTSGGIVVTRAFYSWNRIADCWFVDGCRSILILKIKGRPFLNQVPVRISPEQRESVEQLLREHIVK